MSLSAIAPTQSLSIRRPNQRAYRSAEIDVLRGLVIILMALDHVRDFFFFGSQQHTVPEMVAQRIYGLALGYEDHDGTDRWRPSKAERSTHRRRRKPGNNASGRLTPT